MSRIDTIRQTILADHAASMDIFSRITPEQWEKPVPSDEGAEWKARDVLAHLAVSEEGQLGQITRCLAGEATVPDDFDLTRFNRRSVQKQANKPVEDLLNDIKLGHAKVVAALNSIAEGEFDKTGRHARGDVITVEKFFIRITRHRKQHAEQLKETLSL